MLGQLSICIVCVSLNLCIPLLKLVVLLCERRNEGVLATPGVLDWQIGSIPFYIRISPAIHFTVLKGEIKVWMLLHHRLAE